MKVSPVVNCGDIECARKRFEAAAGMGAPSVHIDVGDGIFAPVVIGGTPDELRELLSKYPIEAHVHLMVANPENVLESWFKAGAKRAVIHIEALQEKFLGVINDTKESEIFLGLKKETPVDVLNGFLNEPGLKGVHLLAVPIGYSGGKFDGAVLEKIKYIKSKAPRLIVSVDGGIDPETAKAVKAAGGDEIVSSTYIFGSVEPEKAYEDLKAI